MNDEVNKKVRRIDPPSDADSQADEEKAAFESPSSYEKESRENEHKRGELLKNSLHILVVSGVIIIGGLLIIGIVIWALHVLMPNSLHWLSTTQVNEIQKIMTSALLALVISDYSKKYLK